MSAPRALICPPTGPGSLGDQAMVVALASRLIAEGFAVDAMPPFGYDGSWDHLAEVSAHVPYPDGAAPRAVIRLVALMRRYERLRFQADVRATPSSCLSMSWGST